MRTDVKVGLVCVLALVVAVITYFALEGKTKEPTQTADNHSANVADHKDAAPAAPAAPATPADPTAAGVSPPAAPAIVTPPAAYSQAPTGQVSPPSPASPPADAPSPTDSGPRKLLPPTGPSAPTVPPLNNEPTTIPTTPSIINPADRPGEPEQPGSHRDSLIETHGLTGPTHPYTPEAPIVPAAPAGSSTYTVVTGDNLTNIARKNHTTVAALKAANPTINPDKLKVKQVINLPAPGADVPTTRPAHPASTRPGHPATTRPAHPATTRPAHVAAGTYTVKKGDTLHKIAKAVYGDEKLWRRIFRANRGDLANPNDITPGMVLKIPSR